MPRKRLNPLDLTDLVHVVSRRKEVDLPSGAVVGGYLLRTEYDYLMTGGTGVGAVHANAGHRLASTITIEVDQKPLVHVRARTLAHIAELFGTPDLQTPPTAVAAGTDQNDRLVNIRIPLTLERVGKSVIRNPYQIALATAFSKVRALIQWAAAQEIVTNVADGVVTFENVPPEMFEEELLGVPNVPGYAPLIIRHDEFDIVAGGADKRHELDVPPGMEVLAVVIETLEDTGNGTNWAPVDTPVTFLALEIGGVEVQKRTAWAVLQEQNIPRFELAAKKTGVVVLDAVEDGSIEPGDLWTHSGRNKPAIIVTQVAPAATDTRQICVTTLMTGGKHRRARAAASR